jgi:hypothetical protein
VTPLAGCQCDVIPGLETEVNVLIAMASQAGKSGNQVVKANICPKPQAFSLYAKPAASRILFLILRISTKLAIMTINSHIDPITHTPLNSLDC